MFAPTFVKFASLVSCTISVELNWFNSMLFNALTTSNFTSSAGTSKHLKSILSRSLSLNLLTYFQINFASLSNFSFSVFNSLIRLYFSVFCIYTLSIYFFRTKWVFHHSNTLISLIIETNRLMMIGSSMLVRVFEFSYSCKQFVKQLYNKLVFLTILSSI